MIVKITNKNKYLLMPLASCRTDHTKDIDFTPAGVRTRWPAGYADTRRTLEEACWLDAVDAIDGVIVHEAA